MSLFDQIVSREITRRRQVVTEREKELADPTKSRNLVAKMMRQHVPEGRKVKTKKHPTKLAAVEAAISKEDPRHELGSKIVASYESALRDPEYAGYRPRNILAAVTETEAARVEEPTRRFIQKQKVGTFSTFMQEPYAPLPGQEEWEAAHPPRIPHMRAEESFAWGAGTKAAIEAGKWVFEKGAAGKPGPAVISAVGKTTIAVAPKLGRRKAIALLAKAGPYGRLAATGVAAIAGMRAFEEVSVRTTEQIMKTEAGKKHPLVAELMGMGVGLAAGAVVPVEAMFGEMLTSKGAKSISKFQRMLRGKKTAGDAASANPSADEIIKFKAAEEAAAKASDAAVATIDKSKTSTIARLVNTLEKKVATEKAKAVPLPGAVARRGIFTPEGLEAMKKVGRTPSIPAEGVIKYTPEELERARRAAGVGVPVKTTAIPIEGVTPNLPMLRPDGSLATLGPRGVIKYGYKDVKTEEGFDRVLSEVADGKKAIDATQLVGEMEEGVKRQFSGIAPKKVKATVKLKKKMSNLGYDADEVAAMDAKVASNITRFSEKKEPSARLDRILREPIPKKKESMIDLSGVTQEEKLYNWARTLPDQQRLTMVERGTISEALNRRIVKEKREVIERGKTYKEFAVKEAEADDVFMKSMGTGSVPKEDGSYKAMTKAEFVLKMMSDAAKKDTGKALAVTAASASTFGALSMPDEAEAGVMSTMAKVFKAATRDEGKAVASRLKLEYNGVQEGIDGPVCHLFTDLRRGATFAAKSADEVDVKAALEANEEIWRSATAGRKTAIGATIFAAINTTIGSLFAPGEAEAAGIKDIGRVVSGLTATLIKDAKPAKVKDLIKGMKESGLIGKSQVDHCYVLPEPRKSLNIIPNVKDVTKKKSMPPGAEAVVSPQVQFLYYTGVREGQELMNNAGVQWGSCQSTSVWNSIQGHKTLMNIMEDFIPGYSSNAKNVINDMAPLIEKYHKPMQERSFHLGMSRHFKRVYGKELSKLEKRRKFKKGEVDEGLDTVVALETLYKKHESLYKASEGMKNAYRADWTTTVEAVARKKENSGTRVFLAAEDTANFENYPWLKDVITWEEKAAAAKIRDMMEHYSVRVIEAGEKVITKQPFMHHAWHPKMKSSLPELADKYTIASPPMTKLHSRSAGYMPMVPDAEYSVTSYLQDINIRLEAMEFWKKGEKDGWWAYKKWLTENPSQAPEGLIKAFTQFEKGFKPVDTSGGFNKFSETVYAFEVARLLAFSASVPFKHALKLVADLRVFGTEGIKAMPKAAAAVAKVAIKQRGGEEWLKKRDWGLDLMDEAVETYTETGKLYRVVSDISPFRVNESMADKAIGKFNEIGGTPTSIVERFDRALSVVAAMNMAAKKGMTPAQSTYAVFDTILKSNFLSGQLNPSWLRNPAIRLMMIFQGTPFKIMEQRIALHGRAWKGAGEALAQLRRDVIKGEQDFKWEMIKQGFGKQKDIFGNTLLSQSIREMILVGTGITAAKYVWDGDLSHHFFHPPFFKAQRRDIAIGASPLVNASVETYSKYMDEDYDEFIVSTFFGSWFDSTWKGIPAPIPVNFKKAARLSEKDIPEIYRDSRLRYLFGIPATHE